MNHWRCLLAASAAALAAQALLSSAPASPNRRPLPLKPLGHVGPYLPPYVAPKSHKSGTWTDLSGALPFKGGPDTALLLTDATVLVHDYCEPHWYKLTPDNKGFYEDGTWSAVAAMPSGYNPMYFASEILPDGRMIVNGGTYNDCSLAFTNQGALYDPLANSWTSVQAPSGWSTIGSGQSVILPNGSYMLANCCNTSEAIATISGTSVSWTATGTGKGDTNEGEGWTNLPNGDLLTVDVWNYGKHYNYYELFDTSSGTWNTAGRTPDLLSTPSSDFPVIGPAVLRSDGTVIQFSGNTASGKNDLYDLSKGTWTSGPRMKFDGTMYDCAEAPAVLLPDDNVLVQASPGAYKTPSHFWEFSVEKKGAMKFAQVDDPLNAPNASSFEGRFLELPTGQVLWNWTYQIGQNESATYTPRGKPHESWLPKIDSVATTLTVGSTGNAISGTNFNGFSQGATYGDDAQMSTNYPLVRITNNETGDVCFGRSYNFSTMGVFTTGMTSSEFDIPTSCESGASKLQVIVNGIASKPASVTLKS